MESNLDNINKRQYILQYSEYSLIVFSHVSSGQYLAITIFVNSLYCILKFTRGVLIFVTCAGSHSENNMFIRKMRIIISISFKIHLYSLIGQTQNILHQISLKDKAKNCRKLAFFFRERFSPMTNFMSRFLE